MLPLKSCHSLAHTSKHFQHRKGCIYSIWHEAQAFYLQRCSQTVFSNHIGSVSWVNAEFHLDYMQCSSSGSLLSLLSFTSWTVRTRVYLHDLHSQTFSCCGCDRRILMPDISPCLRPLSSTAWACLHLCTVCRQLCCFFFAITLLTGTVTVFSISIFSRLHPSRVMPCYQSAILLRGQLHRL